MTASYTYSQPSRVAAATPERVRAAAAALGYSGPHPGARSLRGGRAGSLGVVIGERLAYAFDDPQAARFLAGVAEVCAGAGIGITLVPTGGDDDTARVADAAVDGFVVWTTTEDDPVLDAVEARGLPAVIHAGPAPPGLPAVGIDDRAAARAIGQLAFAGARRPAVLAFPLDRHRRPQLLTGTPAQPVAFPVTRERWRGLLDAWLTSDGRPDDLRTAVCARNDAAHGEAAARELLCGPHSPDALAAMSDELALGALSAARSTGVAVPERLAVTGWDDAPAAEPAGLTTVAQSLRRQGRRCAQLALGHRPPVIPSPAGRWSVGPRPADRAVDRPAGPGRSGPRAPGAPTREAAASPFAGGDSP